MPPPTCRSLQIKIKANSHAYFEIIKLAKAFVVIGDRDLGNLCNTKSQKRGNR
jgi:hypothetical protein